VTFNEFIASLAAGSPPEKTGRLLAALWEERKGNWEKAHTMAQEVENRDGAWIHAYLHRREGDHSNASYWYSRAGRSMPDYSLDDEWQQLVEHFINADEG
jgi:hypothetical protein